MCKSRVVALLICFCYAPAFAQPDCVGKGEIQGQVLNSEDQPVRGAKVSILSEQCAVIGIAPTAVTDGEGRFVLSGVPPGLNSVHAQIIDARDPDTTAAIYADDSAPLTKVVVETGKAVCGVVVRLAKKAGLLSGEIVDTDSSKPVLSARIRISLPDNDRIMLAMGPDSTGHFQLLLPARPVKLTVKALGYEPWLFTSDELSPGLIQINSDASADVTVKLRNLKE